MGRGGPRPYIPPAVILCGMGITVHTTGTDNVKSLANLTMLCGHMGTFGGAITCQCIDSVGFGPEWA
jgi:anaerobic selenocysteine-containing dehydrogenase